MMVVNSDLSGDQRCKCKCLNNLLPRCKQLQETTHQLEYRNSSLELKFSELTQKLLQCQAREVDLRDQLASSLPQVEKTSLEGQIQELKKREAELRLCNSQLQEVAEVARQQAVAMETKKQSHDIELSSLRHQLLDVQMQSDEKSVIGKLHHQIVALQVHMYIHVKLELSCMHINRYMYMYCLLYTSPSPRDATLSRMPSSA